MIRKFLAISLACLIVSCSGSSGGESAPTDNKGGTHTGNEGGGKPLQERLMELEESGEIPKLERGSTLTGSDLNANGVRDDIEAILARNYSSDAQHAAAMQTAKALQKTLTVDTTNLQAVKAVAREISYGINCIYSKFDGAEGTTQPSAVVYELRAITTNTKQRLLAYLQFNKALDGSSSALPKGDTCE